MRLHRIAGGPREDRGEFDTGKCIWRGSPFAAELYYRSWPGTDEPMTGFRWRRCGAAAGTRHEMSCSVMRCHVSPPPRPSPPASPKRRPSQSCMSFLRRVPFRFVPAAAGLPAARPCFARIACARAPAFAPARFARLIARAWADAGRTSPVRSFGVFRTGARQETKWPPDAASSCLILPRFYRGQALTGNYFIIHEQNSASSRRRRDTS